MFDASRPGLDDLTYQYAQIIQCNENLKKNQADGSAQHVVNDFRNLLQFQVSTYIDNERPGVPQVIFYLILFLFLFFKIT